MESYPIKRVYTKESRVLLHLALFYLTIHKIFAIITYTTNSNKEYKMYPEDPKRPDKINRAIEVAIIIFSLLATAFVIWDAIDKFLN